MGLPLLKDWSEFGRLRLDDACAWSAMYERQMRVFVQGARDRFGISHFILINGLNFIFELIGAMETYTSLMETPDMVREAMELGFRLNLSVQKRFFDAVPLLAGGTCGLQVQWVPGRILAESVDPFHMTSVACFEEWGRAISERMFAMFDGGVTHIHGNGRHLLEPVHTLSGLKAIILGDDIGFPPAIEILSDLRKRIGDIPLVVNVRFGVFEERLKRRDLPGGVLYIVESAPGVDEANKLMDTVRAYRT